MYESPSAGIEQQGVTRVWRCGWLRGASLLLGVLCCAACARDVRVPYYPVDDASVVVLEPPVIDARAEPMMRVVAEAAPAAGYVAWGDWALGLQRALESRQVVVIPDARQIPTSMQPVISAFLASGGRALFVGSDPFSEPATPRDGKWVSHDEHLTHLRNTAADIPGFSTIQLWRHERHESYRRSAVRVARDTRVPWPGVDVEVDQFYRWDRMEAVDVADALEGTTFTTLTGYLRGSSRTTRVVFRAEEDDGSVWVYVAPVTPSWKPFLIRESDWVYARGNPARNKSGRGFHLASAVSFSIGLDARYAPQPEGRHQYGIADIRAVNDAELHSPANESAHPFIASPSARFDLQANVIQGVRSHARHYVGRAPVQAVWGDPVLSPADAAGRWVPLYHARDRSGEEVGEVAGLCIAAAGQDGPVEAWGWIGMDAADRGSRAALRMMINELLFRLQRGRFMVGIECEKVAWRSSEVLTLNARLVSFNADPVLARLTAELLDAEGQILRRVLSPPLTLERRERFGEVQVMNVGVLPRVSESSADYTVRLGLEEVGGQSLEFDHALYPIKIIGTADRVDPQERPRVSGARIVLGRIPLFFLGVEYDPGIERKPGTRWLAAGHFPAERIKRDLEQLRNAGVNTLILTYTDAAQAPQLRYVIEEAKSHSMWVQLRMPLALKYAREPDRLRTWISALRLADEATVFSIDIAPDTLFDVQLPGRDLDEAWTAWLLEQFGEAAVVERMGDWMAPRGEIDAGGFRFPQNIAAWSPDHEGWGLIRRFASDWLSREMGHAVRVLRDAGCRQLITARVRMEDGDYHRDWPPGVPLDPGVGAWHLDVVSLGSHRFSGHPQDSAAYAFSAAYTRGMAEGRPLLWSDFSMPVGASPAPEDFEFQAQSLSALFSLALGTHASGALFNHHGPIAASRFAFDEGLVNPGGSRRPALRMLREAANRLRSYRIAPAQWSGREVNPAMQTRGVADIWNDWLSVYQKELAAQRAEEIRPIGYGHLSSEVEPHRVSGGAAGPFVHMNAEWGEARVDGELVWRSPGEPLSMRPHQELRIQLLNAGTARWARSQDRAERTVWVEAARAGHRAQYLEVEHVPPGRRIVFAWRPADPGVYVLRPHWLFAGGFGEALVVQVVEDTR